jgi:hypothetical protein
MKIAMANKPGLISELHTHLSNDGKLIDIEHVRPFVSSPRLMDVCIRNFSAQKTFVGNSFLDQRTMLADNIQRTYGISLLQWESLKSEVELIENYHPGNACIAKVQIWPFCPSTLTEDQGRLAVALSYTYLELYSEPRIVGALNYLLEEIGFFVDPERY